MVPCNTVPFFSSIVTVSLFNFIKNLIIRLVWKRYTPVLDQWAYLTSFMLVLWWMVVTWWVVSELGKIFSFFRRSFPGMRLTLKVVELESRGHDTHRPWDRHHRLLCTHQCHHLPPRRWLHGRNVNILIHVLAPWVSIVFGTRLYPSEFIVQ